MCAGAWIPAFAGKTGWVRERRVGCGMENFEIPVISGQIRHFRTAGLVGGGIREATESLGAGCLARVFGH